MTESTTSEVQMKIKLYSWSNCAGEWLYYGSFNSKDDIDRYIKSKGFDKRYFKYI